MADAAQGDVPTGDLPGYKVDAVEAWVSDNVEGLTPPFKWTRLEGGHSNLTYKLEDTKGRVAVIRRPPEGELLPKAHDMSREWSLISALSKTNVPVPAAYGFCESPDVTGAWFYVMGWVDGKPLYTAEDTEALIPESERARRPFRSSMCWRICTVWTRTRWGLATLARKTATSPANSRPGTAPGRRPSNSPSTMTSAPICSKTFSLRMCRSRGRPAWCTGIMVCIMCSSGQTIRWRRWWTGKSQPLATPWRIWPMRRCCFPMTKTPP